MGAVIYGLAAGKNEEIVVCGGNPQSQTVKVFTDVDEEKFQVRACYIDVDLRIQSQDPILP